jgi:uncharacterized protein DUF6883
METPPPEPRHLPRAERAVVPPPKLRDYALNPDHDLGRHKARLFVSELGIGQHDWKYLAEQLMAGVQTTPVSRIDIDAYGARYEVIVSVDGLNGATVPVVSAWFIPHLPGDAPPRLATTYVYRP